MEIIPIHYTPSAAVMNWHSISDQAEEMATMFEGTSRMAIHHCYVSERPLNFFVLNDEFLKDFMPKLESRYIVNPKIKSFVKASVMDMPEACVAFKYRSPKRVARAFILRVEYDIPDPLQKNGLRHVEKEVERIIAQIFQHEIDHSRGKNIYFDKPKA